MHRLFRKICCADRSWKFIFWSWKSHGKSLLKKSGHHDNNYGRRPSCNWRVFWLLKHPGYKFLTRLPSNLSPTTRECLRLVRCAHFQSRNKDGGHTRSTVAENAMLRVCKLHGCVLWSRSYWLRRLREKEFSTFFLLWLWLDLMTRPSYTNLTHIPWRYTGCANMNFPRQGFREVLFDRQTDMTKIIYYAALRVVENCHIEFQSSDCAQ